MNYIKREIFERFECYRLFYPINYFYTSSQKIQRRFYKKFAMSVPLETQIERAFRDYPFMIQKDEKQLQITFPDAPQSKFEIHFEDDYPKSPPIIFQNEEEFKPSIVTYWSPVFTLTQVLQNLHVYTSASNSPNSIKMTPPINRKFQNITPLQARPRNHSNSERASLIPTLTNNERMGSRFSTPRKSLPKIRGPSTLFLSGISEDLLDEPPPKKLTEEEFQKAVNELKLRFKKKEIGMGVYSEEYTRLKALKQEA